MKCMEYGINGIAGRQRAVYTVRGVVGVTVYVVDFPLADTAIHG